MTKDTTPSRHLPRLTLRMFAPAMVLFWVVMAFIGPLIAPYDVGEILDTGIFEGMSRNNILGTDYFGRDILSRILAGTRYTVGIALAATSISVACGSLLGLGASAIGGFFDAALSRFLDALISIPSKMFGLVVVAAFGSSLTVLILTLGIIYLPGCYRMVRSVAVNVAALDFVTVARARGEGTFYIMLREILPNMIGPVLADFEIGRAHV